MAIQSNFPAIKPSLNLDFVNTKKLDSRITFTRASTATYYDGVTTAKAEENLFRQSQDFTDATYWITNAGVVSYTANTTVAPDGTTTADTMTATVGTGTRYGSGNANNGTITGLVYTASLFVQAGTDTVVQLLFPTAQFGADAYANFDLSAGTVGSVGASATATISSAGGTWYRCVITATATASSTTSIGIGFAFTGNNSSATRLPSITAAGTETLILWGAQLEQRDAVTAYTPTTTQAITNYIPVLLTAANDVPRFDHNPTTDESLGLLIEESRTNLFTYSADYSLFPPWNKVRSSITSNTIVAPDGTLTGSKLVEDTTASNTHTIRQDFTLAIGTYTYSVFAKAGERTVLQCVRTNTNIDTITHVFNLSTGVATGTGASMTPVGNGWYRCVGVITVNTAAATGVLFALNDGSTTSYTGDGYSGIYIWGAQLEAGAFPTSYIATGAATATRSADPALMTGPNFSSWYNPGEGALYGEGATLSTGYNAGLATLSDGTLNNRMTIRGMNSSNQSASIGVSNSVVQWAPVFSSQTTSQTKFALGYKVNDIAFTRNAATPLTDSLATIPPVNQFRIGSDGDGTLIYNGYLRRIAYYPQRLTNAQLQALTG